MSVIAYGMENAINPDNDVIWNVYLASNAKIKAPDFDIKNLNSVDNLMTSLMSTRAKQCMSFEEFYQRTIQYLNTVRQEKIFTNNDTLAVYNVYLAQM